MSLMVRFATPILLALALCSCASNDSSDSSSNSTPSTYRTRLTVKLRRDEQGRVPLTDIQGPAFATPESIAGHPLYAIVLGLGEQPGNAKPLSQAVGTMRDDLTAEVDFPDELPAGGYELAAQISVSKAPFGPPKPEDLVAFGDPRKPPAAGEPPPTGQTVRFRVTDADTEVALDGSHFIVYGKAGGGAR